MYSCLVILLIVISAAAQGQILTSEQVFSQMRTYMHGSLSFDPDGTMYVSFDDPSYRTHKYRSTDKGQGWQLDTIINNTIGSTHEPTKELITIDKFGVWFKQDNPGTITKISSDKGATWQPVRVPASVAANGGMRPGIACFSVGQLTDGKGTIYLCTDRGVHTTTDLGKTWSRSKFWDKFKPAKNRTHCLSVLTTDSVGNVYVGINVMQDKDHKLELNTSNGRWYVSHGFYIVRSTDGGKTWTEISNFLFRRDEFYTWGRELFELEWDRNGNMIASTSEGIFRSSDGKTFDQLLVSGEYFGRSMTRDPFGNIYVLLSMPNDKGVKLISP